MANSSKPINEEEFQLEEEEELEEVAISDSQEDVHDEESEEEEEVESEEAEEEDEYEKESEPMLRVDADDKEDAEEKEDEKEKEAEDEETKREAVRKLLEPFGKDQLISLLKQASSRNPAIISKITEATQSDPVHRKIFVHGLAWDATNETLEAVFKPFGPIEEHNVVTDKLTGKSKGYGFVLMKTREGARRALKEPQKMIGTRMTSCQLASAGPVAASGPNSGSVAVDNSGRKLYVAHVSSHVNPEKLRAFFEKFGEIEEGPIGCDRNTGMPRGYAIFVYKMAEGCRKALEEPVKMFEGCQFQCKRAAEGGRGGNNNSNSQTGQQMPMTAPGVMGNEFGFPYGMGMNPGMMGHGLNPAASLLMGHNPGMFGFGGLLNYPAFGGAVHGLSTGIPPVGTFGTGDSLGLGSLYGGQLGIGGLNPSIGGVYGGLGAYQSGPLGQSSATGTASQSSIGSLGTYSSSYR